jgi:hypothetical protein
MGFRPLEIKDLLDGIEVDNISIGGSNMTAVEEIVNMAYENMPREEWPRTTFALGIFYQLFVPDASMFHNGVTALEDQGLTLGRYERDSTGAHPTIPDRWRPAFSYSMRPLLFSRWLKDVFLHPRRDYNTFTLTSEMRKEELDHERTVAGRYEESFPLQFTKLDHVARMISSRGGRLVLMELPVPSWIQAGVPACSFYRAEEDRQIRELLKIPGVTYGSMAEGFSDDEFYDQFHPRPRTTVRWARKAAAIIREGSAR